MYVYIYIYTDPLGSGTAGLFANISGKCPVSCRIPVGSPAGISALDLCCQQASSELQNSGGNLAGISGSFC